MTEPAATQVRRAFSIVGRVELNVHASAERIWALLTDAAGFPRWNSTVTGIEGEIREGGDGSTHFTMAERFSGLLLPFVELPDFRPIFSQYASDLKREAERAPSG